MSAGGPAAGGGREGFFEGRFPLGATGTAILILILLLFLLIVYLLTTGQPLQ